MKVIDRDNNKLFKIPSISFIPVNFPLCELCVLCGYFLFEKGA